jgi:molybdopterin converting factor small subunit
MRVTVKLYSMLRGYLDEHEKGAAVREFADGSTIADVLSELGIPEKIPKITLVNGDQRNLSDSVAEGDTLSVFPPMAGG